MINYKVHEVVRRLYEDTIAFAREYEFRERPDTPYSNGNPCPTKEERQELVRRANAAQELLKAACGPFRIARDRRTDQNPLILGQWLSWHEWIVEHCLVLLRTKLVSPWPRDDVFEDAEFTENLQELTAEASDAAEMFPAELVPAAATTDMNGRPIPETSASDDYRSVRWYGSLYSFTPKQAPVVRLLWEHWQRGTADVGDETLLNEIDHANPPKRLANVFRGNPAWGTMIVEGGSKGAHRLVEPGKNSPRTGNTRVARL